MNARRGFLMAAIGAASLAAIAALRPGPARPRGLRVSADPDDPAYSPANITHAEVYLDGRRVTNCVTADEELGRAWCLRYSSWDKWQAPERALREVRGDVRVVLLPGHPWLPGAGRGYVRASDNRGGR